MEYLILIAAVFALLWSRKSRRRPNKFAGILLAISVILHFVTFMGLNTYAPFAFGFFTLFAGFEPMNSFKFKIEHKVFYGYASIVSFAFVVKSIIKIPFEIYLEWALIPIPFISYYFWRNSKRVVYQRVGVLAIWSAQAIVAFATSSWTKQVLSELF